MSARRTTGRPRRKNDRLDKFGAARVAVLKWVGRFIGSFFLFSRSVTRNCKTGNGEELPGRNRSPLDPHYFPKDAHQCLPVSSLFAENPDYIPLLLAPFGAIASLSSERNAINKSSALTMNRFPSRRAIFIGKSSRLLKCKTKDLAAPQTGPGCV